VIVVPSAVFEFVGRELNVDGGDVLAFGSERRIEKRGDGDVEVGRLGNFAVFRGVVGALEVVDFVADVDAAGESLHGAVGADCVGESGESWEAIEREIYFCNVAGGTDVADAKCEGRIELRGIDQIEERAFGVDAGDDGFGGDFFTLGEDDSGDRIIFDTDVLDVGLRTNFGAHGAGGFGESLRESAKPTLRD